MSRRSAARALFTGMLLAILAAQTTLAAGVTWSGAVAVGPEQRYACDHALAASTTSTGSVVHATYTSANAPHDSVFYRSSRDGGSTWATGATLSSNPSVWKQCPTVAALGNLVVVSWRQGTVTATAIRLRVSVDGGRTWGPERRLPTTRPPGLPSVAISGSRILLAWTDDTGSQLWSRIAMSGDRGVSWSVRALDAQPTAAGIGYRSPTLVAASGTRVFAAWMRTGGTRIIGRVSLDAGRTWQAPAVLAETFTPTDTPGGLEKRFSAFSIAARPDRMALAWTGPWTPDLTDVPSLFVRVFAGGAWRAPSEIVDGPPVADTLPYGYLLSPSVSLLATTRVGVAWNACHDFRGASDEADAILFCGERYGGDFDPRWAESSNNGVVWTDSVILAPDEPYSTIRALSAVWVSADLRGVLITRTNGEPDWDLHLRFSRGSGLP